MHDALLVRSVKGFGDLPRDGEAFGYREGPARDAIRQRRPFDELQYQRVPPTLVLEPEYGGDVGIVQGGECLRFAS